MQQYSSSPVRIGIASAAAASPNLNRLDKILELVTDHESNYREQGIKLAEVTQKMAELEMRVMQELAPMWTLKERNIPQELDLARTAVETVVRQLTAVTKTNQMLQSELKACQQKQQQQAQQYESAIAVLQADVAALRSRLDDSQQHTRAAVDQLRTSVALQIEQQSQHLEDQLQSLQRENSSQVELIRQDIEAKSVATVRDLESWTKGEMLGLTTKVKAVVAGCASHQQQVNLQMEALQLQWDNTSAAMESLQSEDKRLKKHLRKLQNQTEELQLLAQQAITSEVALQQLRNDTQQLNTAQQQLATRLEVSCSASSTVRQQVQETQEQLSAVHTALAGHNTDLTRLAESVAGCLTAAREDAAVAAAAAAASTPTSYLSTLLAPAGATAAAAAAAGSSSGQQLAAQRRQTWAAWDHQLAEVGDLVNRLHRRHQQTSDVQASTRLQLAGSLPVAAGGSPVRRVSASAGGGSAKYQLQLSSPGGSSAGVGPFVRR